MNVVGIIAEYNPLHNGHAYHMQEARRLAEADYVICIMSGHFVQRGEPAISDKWQRARWALGAGADVVLELPVQYSLQSAETFAQGAVGILDGLGAVTHLCFGAEPDALPHLQVLADLYTDPPESFHKALRLALSDGKSYPAARAYATCTALGRTDILPSLSEPNAILAVEYLCALRKCRSPIKPIALPRRGAHYHAKDLHSEYASATAIRQALHAQKDPDALKAYLPGNVWEALSVQWIPPAPASSALDTLLIQTLRDADTQMLSQLPGVSEGLEYAIKTAVQQSSTFRELLRVLKSRRYTQTRLQRIVMCALLTAHHPHLMQSDARYARLLGFQEAGAPLLSSIKKQCSIPFITKAADYHSVLPERQHAAFELNARATDIYMLCMQKPPRIAGADFTENIIRI